MGAAKCGGLFGLGTLLPSSGDPAARGRSVKTLANYATKFAAEPSSRRHCGRVSKETQDARSQIGAGRVAGADGANRGSFCFAGIEHKTGDDGSAARRNAGRGRAWFELAPGARWWGGGWHLPYSVPSRFNGGWGAY